MNTLKFDADDPRVTAYALGELDGPEAATVAAAVAADPELQAVVDDVRAMAGTLASALAEEALPTVKPIALPRQEVYPLSGRKVVRFPYYWVSGSIAAAFAVLFAVYERNSGYEMEEKSVAYDVEFAEVALPEAMFAVDAEETPAEAEGLVRKQVAPSKSMRYAATAPMMMSAPPDDFVGTEGYAPTVEAGWQRVGDHPLSTFAIDVDSASYANVRRFLNRGELPPVDAVRVEELINAFTYDYTTPDDEDRPFAAQLEVGSAPWAPEHRLVRIGLKGREFATGERAAANLVFLLDVSGSMNAPQKLPLVKEAMRMLVGKLRADDRVAIVTYAGASGLALPSTAADRRRTIYAALDALQPNGATNGAMGIELAYDIARANFVERGINRVILCTDGDFNVGTTNEGDLGRLITEKAKSGVFLTALGFGMGNYQDATLEQLADKGNGNYGYIDSAREARRLLVEEVDGTLATIAKDVKIQVEFNPVQVAAYRLIGYENRLLAKEDFNNDRKDGGEIGAGHTVTALYEIVPVGVASDLRGSGVDELRYAATTDRAFPAEVSHEMLTVKVRAKLPDGDVSRRWEFTLIDQGTAFAATTPDFKFASAVAAFGMLLRDSSFRGTATWARVVAWAEAGVGRDESGYRREFMELVRQAEALMPR